MIARRGGRCASLQRQWTDFSPVGPIRLLQTEMEPTGTNEVQSAPKLATVGKKTVHQGQISYFMPLVCNIRRISMRLARLRIR